MIIPLEVHSVSGSCLYDDIGSTLINFYQVVQELKEHDTYISRLHSTIEKHEEEEIAEIIAALVFKQISEKK